MEPWTQLWYDSIKKHMPSISNVLITLVSRIWSYHQEHSRLGSWCDSTARSRYLLQTIRQPWPYARIMQILGTLGWICMRIRGNWQPRSKAERRCKMERERGAVWFGCLVVAVLTHSFREVVCMEMLFYQSMISISECWSIETTPSTGKRMDTS